jgi:hypothetical protein
MVPKEPEKATWEYVLIGDESFGTFYSEMGLDFFLKIVTDGDENEIAITDEKGNDWELQKFIDHLETLTILKN